MPNFVECPHCFRLYSRHSLAIHAGKCLENTERDVPPSMASTTKKKKTKKPALERPRTRSLSRKRYAEDLLHVCTVCGNEFEASSITEHKERCIEAWKEKAKELSGRFSVTPPQELLVPSVDGTTDVARENEHARRQSQFAQIARCLNCNARVSFAEASAHQCVRFEPLVEFYF
ncbi:unnamed protein product [Caenorhabditis auriculariae]|uniref:Uncharacterized protein n=1 Tax=Caenorhabditis auriculariae TaxID=2777116 RepID=A0A8S1HII1_9PELO|nr:unnamed protein product [Caenorhabditis auriculariae]